MRRRHVLRSHSERIAAMSRATFRVVRSTVEVRALSRNPACAARKTVRSDEGRIFSVHPSPRRDEKPRTHRVGNASRMRASEKNA
jgi:hypothetical protein